MKLHLSQYKLHFVAENVIQEIHGGIRSAMSYCGHSDISDLIYTRSVRLDKPFECGASVL